MATVGDLVGACLRAVGVERVFGKRVPGVAHVAVPDSLGPLLADCDGRLGAGPGCALTTDGVLRLSSQPGATVEPYVVDDPADVPVAIAHAAPGPSTSIASAAMRLAVDFDAGAPAGAEPLTVGSPEVAREPLDSAEGPVLVLAGPGVVRAGALPFLHAFAAAANLPVANTWGAKGVYPWDSPHHMGTAGLQDDDFRLLGFGEAGLIVASGIDPDESPAERFALAPVAAVTPGQLSAGLAAALTGRSGPKPSNRLHERLAAIAQPGYRDEKVPLHPARAVADLRGVLPAGGVIAADPGLAGLWVARTFPTTEPDSVIVPATAAPGVAAGVALAAALRGRRAIAVVGDPVDDVTAQVADLAARLDARFVLDVWTLFGDLRSPDEHRVALAAALREPGQSVPVVRVPVAAGDVHLLVEAAGAVVAWDGLAAAAEP